MEQLHKFIQLWTILQEVVLQPYPDLIRWKWRELSTYTTTSTYRCLGSYAPFRSATFWKGHVEAKRRFFAWLALHRKALTPDNLTLRRWPHDPICKLCRIHQEMVQQLTLDCHFSTTVREQIFSWNGTFGVPPPQSGKSLNDWCDEMISQLPKEKTREVSGTIIYSTCGVWKERNMRMFHNTALQPMDMAALVKEDIAQRAYSHTQDPGDGNVA
jgi:hypothetical protein